MGTRDFAMNNVQDNVANWQAEIGKLSLFARFEPHTAYSSFTHGLMNQWTFLLRSIKGIDHIMQPVEDAIHVRLLPAITGREALTDHERDLLALPTRFGSIGERSPTMQANEYNYPQQLSAPLTTLIMEQSEDLGKALEQQLAIKQTLQAERGKELKDKATELENHLPTTKNHQTHCQAGQ